MTTKIIFIGLFVSLNVYGVSQPPATIDYFRFDSPQCKAWGITEADRVPKVTDDAFNNKECSNSPPSARKSAILNQDLFDRVSSLTLHQQIRRQYVAIAAQKLKEQVTLSRLVGNSDVGSLGSFRDLDKSCGFSQDKFLYNSVIGAVKEGQRDAIQIGANNPKLKNLYKRRAAAAILDAGLLALRFGTANLLTGKGIGKDASERLEKLRAVYPQIGDLGKSAEFAQRMLGVLQPKVKGSALNRNSFGNNPDLIRAFAFSQDDLRSADKILLPSNEDETLSIEPEDCSKQKDYTKAKVLCQVFNQDPLPPEIDKIVQEATRTTMLRTKESFAQICDSSPCEKDEYSEDCDEKFCALPKVNPELTSFIVASDSVDKRRSSFERTLCRRCASAVPPPPTLTQTGLHLATEFGVGAGLTALCVLAPPFGCVPGLLYSGSQAVQAGSEAYSAYGDSWKFRYLYSAGIVSAGSVDAQDSRYAGALFSAITQTAFFALDGKTFVSTVREARALSQGLAATAELAAAEGLSRKQIQELLEKKVVNPDTGETFAKEAGEALTSCGIDTVGGVN